MSTVTDHRSEDVCSRQTLLSVILPKLQKSYLKLPVITCNKDVYLYFHRITWLYLIWFRTIGHPMVPLWSSCSIDFPLVVRHFTWNHLSVHENSVLNRGYRKVDYMYINKCLCLIGWLIIPSVYYQIIMPSRISWWTLVSMQYNSQVFMLLDMFCFAVYTSNQTFLVGFWLYNQIIDD